MDIELILCGISTKILSVFTTNTLQNKARMNAEEAAVARGQTQQCN